MDKVKIHRNLCKHLNQLYESKNDDYGDSFKRVRDRVPSAILVRLYDKLYRLDKLLDNDYEQKVKDESIEDTLIDLANYALMELVERKIKGEDTYIEGQIYYRDDLSTSNELNFRFNEDQFTK